MGFYRRTNVHKHSFLLWAIGKNFILNASLSTNTHKHTIHTLAQPAEYDLVVNTQEQTSKVKQRTQKISANILQQMSQHVLITFEYEC